MTERHLRAVLTEAERVAEQYDQVAQTTNSPAHEYLRYAVLRLLEGDANSISEQVPQVDGVTVGYGRDQAMYDSWGSDVEWWDTVPPQDDCTRFRVFYPDEQGTIPRVILTVMAALGHGECGRVVPLAVAPTTIKTGEKSTFSGRKGTLWKHSWKIGFRRLRALSLQMEDRRETFATGCSYRMDLPRQMTSSHERNALSRKR